MAVRPLGLGRVVAERRGDDRARALEQTLGMARLLRPRHGEAHVGEQPASPPFADVPLRLGIRSGRCRADDVDAELGREAAEVARLSRR